MQQLQHLVTIAKLNSKIPNKQFKLVKIEHVRFRSLPEITKICIWQIEWQEICRLCGQIGASSKKKLYIYVYLYICNE